MPLAEPLRRALSLAVIPASLAACEPTQLYMVSHAVVGLNASVNPEQTTGSLLIGYDRTYATVIPRSVATTTANGVQFRDAMSALVCSELAVDGITIRRYTESLATGRAATRFAAKLAEGTNPQATGARVKDFFDCFKDQGTQPPNPAGGAR